MTDLSGGVPVTASLEDRTKKAAEAMADADLEGDGVPSYETLAADALAAAGVPALLEALELQVSAKLGLELKLVSAEEALTEARADLDDIQTDYAELSISYREEGERADAAEAALVGARKAALDEVEAIVTFEAGPGDVYMRADVLSVIAQVRATEGPEQP